MYARKAKARDVRSRSVAAQLMRQRSNAANENRIIDNHPARSGRRAIQRVAAPTNAANITAADIQTILVNAINKEIYNSRPKIEHHKARVAFIWSGIVHFPNGASGDLGLNIHVDSAGRWACGSAWIGGAGVAGVSFNMSGLTGKQQANIEAYTKYWDSSGSHEDEYENEYEGYEKYEDY